MILITVSGWVTKNRSTLLIALLYFTFLKGYFSHCEPKRTKLSLFFHFTLLGFNRSKTLITNIDFDWIYRRGLRTLIISLGKCVNYTENLLFSAASKSLRVMMAFIHLRFASFNKNAQTSTVGNALVWVLALLLSLLVLAYSM